MVLTGRLKALLTTTLLLFALRLSLGLQVRSEFNQRGVKGTIVFSQESPLDSTTITVNLTGLSLHPDTTFLWHVHQYPFPYDGLDNPCRGAVTGGHYDPLGTNMNQNYTQDCAMDMSNCEIGDLSGKFGRLNITLSDSIYTSYTDPTLSLYGVYSVIGRSIVIHLSDGTRLVCANIDYPMEVGLAQTDILYSPFRSEFSGNMFFRGHTDNSTASVYTDLIRLTDDSDSIGHNWHVHENPLDISGSDCSVAGPHYNPLGVDTGTNYTDRCNPTAQQNCEIGDLSNKGSPFDVEDGFVKHFYTDISLPLAGDVISIENRSVVIHDANRSAPRIDCANISRFNPLEAVVNFNEGGLTGSIRFFQLSPFDSTSVTVSLQGLQRMAGGYHVHVSPVSPQGVGSQRCAAADGHWNPTGVTYNPNTTRVLTSDEYEIGDLSGKFGPLNDREDLMETFVDPTLPLFGVYSIVGRSVVIHRSVDGSRWTCANIELVRPVVQVVTIVNTSSLSGRITFTQPADDPYAETTIVVELMVLQDIIVTTPTPSLSSATPTQSNSMPISNSTVIITPSQTMSTGNIAVTTTIQANTTSVFPFQTTSVSSFQTASASPFQTTSASPFQTASASPFQTTSASSFQISPSPTPSTSVIDSGSGDFTMNMLPFGASTTTDIVMTTSMALLPSMSPTPINARRRRHTTKALKRQRRQTNGMVDFDWSVRVGETDPTDCNSLPVYQSALGSSLSRARCNLHNPLACSIGDLTSKHGSLSLPREPGPFRAVFTDPSLPLSGPMSPFTSSPAFVLVQPMGGVSSDDTVACAPARLVGETRPTTGTTPTPTESTTQAPLVGNDSVVIGAVVGGVLAAILLVVVVIVIVLLVVCCSRQRSKYNVSEKTNLELGTVRPSKPILGVPHYRALHDYSSQSEGDLDLVQGDWVTLSETPLGGDWWRGSVEGRGEGWFPRTYVEFVDVEAERKKQQEENFLMAASAIVAASSSFSAHHPSLTQTRRETLPAGRSTKRSNTFSKKSEQKIDLEKVQRSQTFGRRDIDSTPRSVRKLDKPYLADDDNTEVMVIANAGGSHMANGGSPPDTPLSQRNAEFYTNKTAVEGGSSQESEGSPVIGVSSQSVGTDLLQTEKYSAKFDFNGSTDIELEFKKGELISIVEKSDSGWWKGVCEGRVGWFPDSYVRPVPMETREEREAAVSAEVNQPGNMEEMMGTGDDLEAVEYRSVHSFHSDTEGDLEFPEGETVWVYWAQDNGWWFGAAGSAQGWFPGSFVEPVIDLSEAGSVSAIREGAPLEAISESTPQQEDTSLASQLSAAVKKKSNDVEKDSRSSFRKRWSLKRKSRDKSRENSDQQEMLNEQLESEATKDEGERLPGEQTGGLQGQLMAALERRRSFGRDRHLTIDEQIAGGKKRKTSEPHKSRTEIVTDFMRRSFKLNKSSGAEPERREQAVAATEKEGEETAVANVTGEKQTEQPSEPNKVTSSPRKKRRHDTNTRRAPPAPPSTATPTTPKPEPAITPKKSVSEPTEPTQTKQVVSPPSPQATVQQTSTADKGTPPKTTRSYSTAQNHPLQPNARPRKRRTTAAALNRASLPHRRPPPPPPGTTKAQPPTHVSAQSSVESDSVFVNTNTEANAPVVQANKHPPVPPRSSLRPRVQRVKRPVSRMIPPPPNIPLPPPPTKKKTVTESEPSPEPEKRTEKRKSSDANKPPVLPKPAHLRRFTSPSVGVTPTSESNKPSSEPTTSEPVKSSTPKPPPPARSSSLASRPVPAKRKLPSSSNLENIEDAQEEVDSSPLVTDSPLNRKASKSAPPKRPPPPRPASAASKSAKTDRPDGKILGGTVVYDASQNQAQASDKDGGGHSLRTKGTSLMRSLKKMVTRDSRKGSQSSSKESPPSQKPVLPPPRTTSKLSDPTENNTPVPKPRAKVSDASSDTVSTSKASPPTTRPTRPPPPSTVNNKTPPTPHKSAPTRPPPPKPVSTETKELVSPTPQERSGNSDTNETTRPIPAPRNRTPSPADESPDFSLNLPDTETKSHDLEEKSRDLENKSPDISRSRSSTPDTNFYRAVDSYQAQNDKELSFSKGDVLIIVQKRGDGFHFGMLDDGTTGLFPLASVEPFFL